MSRFSQIQCRIKDFPEGIAPACHLAKCLLEMHGHERNYTGGGAHWPLVLAQILRMLRALLVVF